MKTYCKSVDITDPETLTPWLLQAFAGKWKKRPFVRILIKYGGITNEELRAEITAQRMEKRTDAVRRVAKEVARRIENHKLGLEPMRVHYKTDGLSGKTRELIKEDAMQQLLDYVAVNALMPLFQAKIMPQQCACIKGRGQTYGKKMLERWIRRDKQSRHVRQGDIRKCYAHITKETTMRFLERDIHKNKELLWLVDALLSKHAEAVDGLAIGSYLSAWLCNYILSYLCRYICGLHRTRKRKNGAVANIRLIHHVLFYADDFVIIGSRARDVEKAMQMAAVYAQNVLGLEIKSAWQQIDLTNGRVDMMGFVIGYERTTIRRRIFRRARRQYLRAGRELAKLGYIPAWRARKICSYKGYFVHTNTYTGAQKLDAWRINRAAAKSISFVAVKGKQKGAEEK